MVGRSDDIDYSLAQGYSKSDGHRTNASGQLANIMGGLGVKINQNWSASVSGMALNNSVKDPGSNLSASPAVAPTYDTAAQMVTAFAKHSYDAVEGEIRVYSNTGKGNLNNDLQTYGWGNNHNDFSMQGLRWKESITPWQGGNLLLGLDYDSSSGSVTSTPLAHGGGLSTTTTKTTLPTYKLTSPYMGLSHSFMLNNKWSVVPSAGVRNYQNNQYASKTAPYGGISFVSDVATIFFNASQGINYPGMEGPALQASMAANFNQSWKNLSAEEMNHMEVGGKFNIDKKTRVDASLFQDTIKNRYTFTENWPNASFVNYGQYTKQGVELSAQREILPELTVFGGWTYLNHDSTANLPYMPKNAFNAALTGYVGKIRLSVDAQYHTSFYSQTLSRNTGSTNTTLVNGFTVANARVSYPIPALGKKGEVFVIVENIFNQQYSYRQGYPMPGTWGSIGLSTSFN
jgi:iron complex outermembrane receptor protein